MPELPKIDIRPDHWEIVRGILQKHVPQYAVWAFGSRAKWTAKQYSDLDLAVISDQPLSLAVSAHLSDDFSESDLPWRVDVVDWATTSESFRKMIERDKVVVQEGERGWVMASELPITEVVEFNPSRQIKRGVVAPFVDMAALPENQRDISYVTEREFTGGGSRFQNGDTLFARITPCLENGKTAKVSALPDGVMAHGSTEFIVMAAKAPEYDEDYVYYLARHPEFRAFAEARMEGTSGRQRVSWQALSDFSFTFPSPDQRRAIGLALRKIDDKIDLNRRINQTLEAMAQAIFQSWFVDFNPVKAKIAAKAEGRDPLRAAMSAISGKREAELNALPPEAFEQLAATAALFPDEMKESELGEIPKGWAPDTLATTCDLNTNSWNAKTLPATVKYVDLANTKNGEVIATQTMEGSSIPSRARRVLEIGDTIVGTVRPGNRSFALVGEAGLTGSTGFAVLRPRKSYLREYVYLAATADANIQRLAHLADGGAYPAVRPELVVSDALPIPSEDVLCEFHRISSPMFDHVLELRRANRGLADLRDTLLPKLLSGELSVDNLSSNLEAMA